MCFIFVLTVHGYYKILWYARDSQYINSINFLSNATGGHVAWHLLPRRLFWYPLTLVKWMVALKKATHWNGNVILTKLSSLAKWQHFHISAVHIKIFAMEFFGNFKVPIMHFVATYALKNGAFICSTTLYKHIINTGWLTHHMFKRHWALIVFQKYIDNGFHLATFFKMCGSLFMSNISCYDFEVAICCILTQSRIHQCENPPIAVNSQHKVQ